MVPPGAGWPLGPAACKTRDPHPGKPTAPGKSPGQRLSPRKALTRAKVVTAGAREVLLATSRWRPGAQLHSPVPRMTPQRGIEPRMPGLGF